LRTRLLASLLFLSGAGALILEVAWFRRTAQVAGATSVAMAGVLAAVIGGMALGAHLFGKVADRARSPLRLYGLLEVGVALGAALSPTLLALARPAFDGAGIPVRFLLATLILAPPAILMGGTLPAAAAALRTTEARGRDIGILYAANTLGAVCGTFAAGFLLLPALGLAWTMRAAALLPLAAGVLAFLARGAPAAPGAPSLPAPGARRAILLYAASGFMGLVAEVAFTRQLVLVFGSATYAFTTMLGVFLLGIGLGGAIGARIARREAGHLALLETTVAVTAAVFALSALLVYLLPRLYLEGFLRIGGGFGAGLALRLVLAAIVLLPGALGLGIAFPLAAHVATAGAAGSGTGRLYAANTLASIVGSTIAVFWLVPLFGPQHAAAAAALLAALLAAARRRRLLLVAAVAALGLLPAPQVARERLLSGVYFVPWAWTTGGRIDERSWREGVDIPFFEYGREATISVWRWYGTDSVLIDGKAEAGNQVLTDDLHLSLLGHAPMAVHENPQRVLVVGLGIGTTYRAVAAHGPALARVVELEPAVVHAAARLGTRPGDIVLDDARAYLRRTNETFDVITSDPIHPWVRGSGDLYTKEYLESCRARLAPGGVACLWVPLYQMGVSDVRDVLRTFCAVFPSVALFYGGEDLVAVGGQEVGAPRAPAGTAREQLERLSAADLSKLVVARRDRIVDAVGDGPILTDDALRLEYSTPRQVDDHEAADCLRWVHELWGAPPAPYGSLLLALVAKRRADWDGMQAHLDQALKEAPGSAHVRRTRGELYLGMAGDATRGGQIDDGSRYFKHARGYLAGDTRLIGLEADLRAAQGDAAAAAGDVAAAKELYATARELLGRLLEADPGSDYLKRKIAALR
jgi:spermidine synthase